MNDSWDDILTCAREQLRTGNTVQMLRDEGFKFTVDAVGNNGKVYGAWWGTDGKWYEAWREARDKCLALTDAGRAWLDEQKKVAAKPAPEPSVVQEALDSTVPVTFANRGEFDQAVIDALVRRLTGGTK